MRQETQGNPEFGSFKKGDMSERDDILIDKYLRGDLSKEEELLLEERMKDADFKMKMDEATLLLEVLKEEDAKKLKSRMQSLEKEEFEGDRKNLNYTKLGFVVAAILLIAALTYFALSRSEKSEPLEIYAAFYEPYPNVIDPIVKGASDSYSVYQHYEAKDYKKVIQLLDSKDSNTLDEHFYRASTYLAQKDFAKASTIFQQMQISEKYGDAAQWYLALICIHQNKSCNELFDAIAKDASNIYNMKAADLLKELGR